MIGKAENPFRLFCQRKSSRLTHYYTDNQNLKQNRKEHLFRFYGQLYTFVTDDGVFSKKEIDEGTEILLNTICEEDLGEEVLDLGCGYGVIGNVLKKMHPEVRMVCVDINPRAVELAQLNCEKNAVVCDVFASNGFEAITQSFDTIVTNPPIRTGKKNIYHMFEESYHHLNDGGSLYIVIRKQQGAESAKKYLNELFGNCELLERKKGYWILQCRKLTD